MLRSIKEFSGYPIEGPEGELGKVKDILFDDHEWGVRYLVADTGGWLHKDQVLVSPKHLRSPDYSKRFLVKLTRAEIESGPRLEDAAPVSKQYEDEYSRYYKIEPYWQAAGILGATSWPRPGVAASQPSPVEKEEHEKVLAQIEQWQIRSTHEVIGYNIAAIDGEIGHLADMILDTEEWRIRYFVIKTRNWLPGRTVLADTDWIREISWQSNNVVVEMTKEQLKGSPKFDPKEAVNRGYEEQLYDYYGRPRYW